MTFEENYGFPYAKMFETFEKNGGTYQGPNLKIREHTTHQEDPPKMLVSLKKVVKKCQT